jgi:hypothetical protein
VFFFGVLKISFGFDGVFFSKLLLVYDIRYYMLFEVVGGIGILYMG